MATFVDFAAAPDVFVLAVFAAAAFLAGTDGELVDSAVPEDSAGFAPLGESAWPTRLPLPADLAAAGDSG